MTKQRLNPRIVTETGGSQIAEAALVMPLAFMMLLGIYWFGRAFNTYATINTAAREGARLAVVQSCASGPPNCGSPNAAPTAAAVASTVTSTLQASSVDPSQIIPYPSAPVAINCPGAPTPATCSVSGNVTFCNNVPITPSSSPYPQVCGVTVSFQYPYQFWIPFTSLDNQQIILTADVQMKGEY